jgi:hypothetical protein
MSISELRALIIGEAKKAKKGKAGFKAPVDTETAAKKAKETDASEYADSLENPVDFKKALKIEERRLQRRIAKINEHIRAARRSNRKVR